MNTRVIFIGQSDALLEWLCMRQGVEVLRAFITPDHPNQSRLLSICAYYDVDAVLCMSGAEVAARIPPRVDLGICMHFSKLPIEVLRRTKLGILNIHPAPLPDFPGRLPLVELMLSGTKEAGVTIHWMNDQLDQGPVLSTIRFPRCFDDDLPQLEKRATITALKLLELHWDKIVTGNGPKAIQSPREHHRSIRFRENFIPTAPPSAHLDRIKAYYPFGGVPVWSNLVGLVCITSGMLDQGVFSNQTTASLRDSVDGRTLIGSFIDENGALQLCAHSHWILKVEGYKYQSDQQTRKSWIPQKDEKLFSIQDQEQAFFDFTLK